MKLTIVSPKGLVCDAEVESVTFPGSEGSFTVLKNHAPIMATLLAGTIIFVENGEEKGVNILSGIVNVLHNSIDVCVEVA